MFLQIFNRHLTLGGNCNSQFLGNAPSTIRVSGARCHPDANGLYHLQHDTIGAKPRERSPPRSFSEWHTRPDSVTAGDLFWTFDECFGSRTLTSHNVSVQTGCKL